MFEFCVSNLNLGQVFEAKSFPNLPLFCVGDSKIWKFELLVPVNVFLDKNF